MNPKDKALFDYWENEFAKDANEKAEEQARLERVNSKADMAANSPLNQWVFNICWNLGWAGLSSLLMIGISWMINTSGKGPLLR